MEADDALVDRLDRLIALFKIAFRSEIERERAEVREDAVTAAILDVLTEAWVASGDVQRTVAKKAAVSERTVLRGLTFLIERGLVQVRGTGRQTSYRSAGVL